jgi:hypothetical protein
VSKKAYQDILHAWYNGEVANISEYAKILDESLGETMANFGVQVIKQISK